MKMHESTQKDYQIGDVIRTKEPFGPNAAGSIGIVYERYSENDGQEQYIVSILLTNGHDIGCFTEQEQDESFTWLGHAPLSYDYFSPSQLMADYRNGYFQQVMEEALQLSKQPVLTGAEL